jgi:hypothetical protein
MNDTLDLNLWKIWDVKRDVWDMYHKSSPLSNMKVPKIKPIFQQLKSNFISCCQGIPPTMDYYILNIYFF